MNRRTLITSAAALGICAVSLPHLPQDAPTVTHPDGKTFVRVNDHWLPV